MVTIEVPPLRERGDDMRLLAEYFLEFYAQHHKRRIKGFTQAALRAMQAHPWPGNVRELENRIQRAVILAQDAYVRPEDLELEAAPERRAAQRCRRRATRPSARCWSRRSRATPATSRARRATSR